MAKGNVPNLGQRTSGKPGGSAAVVPQGQGAPTNGTRGGPPPVNLAKHTQGKNGKTTVNSMPIK